MDMLIWFLIGFVATLAVLAVILVVTLIRLGKELQQIEANTNSIVKRVQRTIRTVQIAVPLIVSARRMSASGVTRVKQLFKRGAKHDAKTKE